MEIIEGMKRMLLRHGRHLAALEAKRWIRSINVKKEKTKNSLRTIFLLGGIRLSSLLEIKQEFASS